ncbi:MAG: hypothetical protein H0U80_03075, partial [Solirubrobacterales bacterium]|nr:hypothetical protein [Solirubrobacterales bacterium]
MLTEIVTATTRRRFMSNTVLRRPVAKDPVSVRRAAEGEAVGMTAPDPAGVVSWLVGDHAARFDGGVAPASEQQTPSGETAQGDETMPEPSFHTRPWGYDRREVDAFVERTARRLDDALAARSPDAAVREALDRLGDETSSVLQRAHQIADEV